MNRKLRTTVIVSLVAIAIAAALSLALLATAQLWPDASTARIQWGDHSTAVVACLTADGLNSPLPGQPSLWRFWYRWSPSFSRSRSVPLRSEPVRSLWRYR